MNLTTDHLLQLQHLETTLQVPWQDVLNEALSEYRSALGLEPPTTPLNALDAVTARAGGVPAPKHLARTRLDCGV